MSQQRIAIVILAIIAAPRIIGHAVAIPFVAVMLTETPRNSEQLKALTDEVGEIQKSYKAARRFASKTMLNQLAGTFAKNGMTISPRLIRTFERKL